MSNEPSVSVRIRQLQVVELADRMVRSAFGAIEGGYVHNSESMFTSNIVDMPQKQEPEVDMSGFDEGSSDPEPEPVKTPAKKAVAGGAKDGNLGTILDNWDD